jgi:ABC-type uncharacterized transport system substrate-binding protein
MLRGIAVTGSALGRMRRRDVLGALAGVVAGPRSLAAQHAVPVIGYLYVGSLNGVPDEGKKAFWRALAEFGYERGRNVSIELRQAHNDVSRLPDLALDLVHRGVSVIIAPGSMEAVAAARAATDSIPIIFSNASTDPVRAGLVASLNRPGGNITGVADFGTFLSAKRLELAKLLVPKSSRVGILATANRATTSEIANAQKGARSLSLDTIVATADSQEEIGEAFAVLAERKVDVACVIPTALFSDQRAQIVALAARYRLPVVYPHDLYAEIGGLMSYGISVAERGYYMGVYTGLILNGANPADLPVRRLSRFELVVNVATARALGLTVPAGLLAITDRVIE